MNLKNRVAELEARVRELEGEEEPDALDELKKLAAEFILKHPRPPHIPDIPVPYPVYPVYPQYPEPYYYSPPVYYYMVKTTCGRKETSAKPLSSFCLPLPDSL